MRAFFRLLACYWLALCWLGPIVPAQAKPICPPRPISVGLYEFGNFYHAGAGLDKDVADELAARSGCRFELRVLPRTRIWQDVQAGRLDMTLSALRSDTRLTFSWMFPYAVVRSMVILRKDVDPNVHGTEEFLNTPYLRLGVVHGFKLGLRYDALVEQLRTIGRVEEAVDSERLYGMLSAKRFDAVVDVQLVYPAYLDRLHMSDQVRVEDWDPQRPNDPTNIVLSKKSFTEAEARAWGDLLDTMNKDGTMLKLISKYVPKAEAEKMVYRQP
jgi:polar amino acid transport system substrate-binding protein